MKKHAGQPLVTLADHALAELATLSLIVEDILRKGELLKRSRIFDALAHCVAQSIRGYRPDYILYDDQDENVFELMEGAAALLGLLSLSYRGKNYPHITGRRIALGIPRIENLNQVVELNRQIERSGGNLSMIVCLTVNRDRHTITQLQQSPKRIICLTSVDPYQPTESYSPPAKEINASGQ